MASMMKLVDRECGNANPLVNVTSQMLKDAPSSSGLGSFLQPSYADQLANEFLAEVAGRQAMPQSFSMNHLLREINSVDQRHNQMAPQPQQQHSPWAHEYLSKAELHSDPWSQEYLQSPRPPMTTEHRMEDAWQEALHSRPVEAVKWSAEYLEEAENRQKFNDVLNGVPNDPQLWNTEFMKFVQNEYGTGAEGPTAATAEETATHKQNFWDQLESQWGEAANSQDWLNEYESLDSRYNNYQFSEESKAINVADPLAEGKAKLAAGELAAAILLLEAAVKRDENSSEAWQYLGLANAENEQEQSAISALRRCLQLDPKNLGALITLAVSYTNESLYSYAAQTLIQWLSGNPLYADIVPPEALNVNRSAVSSFLDNEKFRELEQMLMAAVRRNVETIDPEVQNALGVLYNMSGDYDKAVDCFKSALIAKPEDSRFWNRLGATLANSTRSAEAVSAYYRALELYPAFVRARYNLGISCMNLKSFREATEHLIVALRLQQQGIGPHSRSSEGPQMFNNIWNTLRMALSQMGRLDLFPLVDGRNIEGLSKEFGIFGEAEQM